MHHRITSNCVSTGAAPRVLHFVFYTLERCSTILTQLINLLFYYTLFYTNVKIWFPLTMLNNTDLFVGLRNTTLKLPHTWHRIHHQEVLLHSNAIATISSITRIMETHRATLPTCFRFTSCSHSYQRLVMDSLKGRCSSV
jgi:hypothetical protein